VDSSGPKKPCIRWGPGYLTGRGTFRWIYLRTLSLARDYPPGQTQRYLQGGLGATMWPQASSTVATCNRSIDSSAVYATGGARSSLSTAFSKTSQGRDQVSRRHGGFANVTPSALCVAFSARLCADSTAHTITNERRTMANRYAVTGQGLASGTFRMLIFIHHEW